MMYPQNANQIPEPSLEPPDPRQFCNDPQCDYCKLSVWDCPGIDPEQEEE